ncbi:hypothetical protein [Mycetohabitans sp. B4]|uniref:Macrolide-specific efflux protein MacA n=1 Tax=Mycetohabitans sp. TaxID=2571162 RepID=A0A6B9HD97_9BURK|nr:MULTISPECIES: hypothetical protein [Burkholderiaceae]MCG1018067.1 hypothetical protein [Mycetohabitans sp. B4]QGY72798.1 macrolide-specific efflux protein MacA [Mycetohabitans sp.]SIT69626.1 hypothetical protein SAMN04487768_1760 [Burkholderia sp. b13]
MKIRRWRAAIVGVIAVVLIVTLSLYVFSRDKHPHYLTANVERGDLEHAVLATGTLQAFTLTGIPPVCGEGLRLNVFNLASASGNEVALIQLARFNSSRMAEFCIVPV